MAKPLQGVFAVIVTPFTRNDKIDEPVLRRHLRFLLDKGKVHGVVSTGSTGEFTALTEAERKQMTDIVIDEVAGKVPVLVGAAAVSTRQTIMYSQYAQDKGADGVMVVAPYYCHPDERELYGHYQSLADNIDIHIMIYNNPGTSGVDIQPELIARLAENKNISYVKESSGDMTRVAEIMRRCGDKMCIFCGCDNLTLEMFLMGVRGWVVAPGNVIPRLCVELYELAVVKKDFAKAQELYFKILPLFTLLETTGQYIQLVKAGLEILGRPVGAPREPLLPPTEEAKQQLKQILDTLPL